MTRTVPDLFDRFRLGAQYFRSLGDNDVVVRCVQAYNDFLTDWTGAAPDRFVAVTATPFWDIDFAVSEIDRCLALGPIERSTSAAGA